MKRSLFLGALAGLLLCLSCDSIEQKSYVEIDTSVGKIKAELYPDQAPETVKNFLGYVDEKHYDSTIFHRVSPPRGPAMIQCGGIDAESMQEKPTKPPIKNESSNGLKNQRGTLAMARTGDPDSATAQFFINVKDNPGLDRPNPDGFGYAVFGKVTEGMDVVDKIKAVPTKALIPRVFEDVPVEDVVIKSVRRAP